VCLANRQLGVVVIPVAQTTALGLTFSTPTPLGILNVALVVPADPWTAELHPPTSAKDERTQSDVVHTVASLSRHWAARLQSQTQARPRTKRVR
jgi:hypothetical protein